ncbi:MFS transporter [Haloparvum sp. PAK95]|uniref:MFS transporter n=1 Tax=Haloparvum sp. PAK95 TaxID=3418962 RepID=UPI003D2EF2CB
MTDGTLAADRRRLATVVWAVLVSQVLIYPGVPDLITALGASTDIRAGMWFLVAEFAAFVTFAGVWGAASDALGKRVPLVVAGAVGGAAAYLLLATLPALGVGFVGALVVRVLGGATTIGAFSLGMTMLMDLDGGHGRNMGAAGIAIGLGAALGSVVGGALADVDPFYPVYAGAAMLLGAGLLAATTTDRVVEDEETPGFAEIGRRVRAMPGLLVPFAFGFIDRLTAGFFSLVGVFYFRDVFGLDAFGAGLTLALFFLPFALLQYPMGILSDRIGRFYPVVAGSLAYGVVILGVGLSPTYPLAAVFMLLVGVCGALMAPATMALVTDLVAPVERGAAMGLFNVFGSLGFLTGFLVGGLASEAFDYEVAFLLVGGLEIGIAVALLPAVRVIAPRMGSPSEP